MKKSMVIYFSQTGNTKKIAEAITSGIKRANEACEISILKTVNARDLRKYDLIGLGYRHGQVKSLLISGPSLSKRPLYTERRAAPPCADWAEQRGS